MLQRLAGMHDSQVDSIHTEMPQTKGRTHEMTSSSNPDGNMMFAASHHTTLFAMMKAMHAAYDQGDLNLSAEHWLQGLGKFSCSSLTDRQATQLLNASSMHKQELDKGQYLFLASRLPVVFTTLPPLPSLSFTNLHDKTSTCERSGLASLGTDHGC